MKVIGWRAWYADGSKYNSKDTKWSDLPDDGVIVVMLYFDEKKPSGNPKRRIMDGSDWYFQAKHESGDFIYGENNDSPEENKKRYGEDISLKKGKWTAEKIMYASQKEAMEAKICPCEE